MGWVLVGLLMLFAALQAEPVLGYVFLAGLVIWAAAIYFHPGPPQEPEADEIKAKIQEQIEQEQSKLSVAQLDMDRAYHHALDEIRRHLHKG